MSVPNIWLRPDNQRREADAAKARLAVPISDHLTLLNVYNQYAQSESALRLVLTFWNRLLFFFWFYIGNDKNWAWKNYISLPALQEVDNVRAQLQRMMERFEIELVTLPVPDEAKLFVKIRQALVCGFFMQIAHKEGDTGNYLTVKDHQVNLLFFFDALLCMTRICMQGCMPASILWTE